MSYPYLVRRNNHYYCRIWIPEDLKPHFNCCEIERSLKTSNCNNARTLVKALVYQAERVFMLMRSGMLTNEQIKIIAANFIKSTLNRTEELRNIAVVTYEDKAATAAPFRFGNAEQVAGAVAQSVSACEALIQRYKDQLFINDFSAIEVRLGWHLEQNKVSVDKSSKEYVKLCREILKAEIEIKKIEIERLKGNYYNSHDMFYQNTVLLAPVPNTVSNTPIEPSSPEFMLTNIILEYINEVKLSGRWTEKTGYENTSLLDHFVRIMGDRDIRSITHKDMLEFRDTISKLPANMNKIHPYHVIRSNIIIYCVLKVSMKVLFLFNFRTGSTPILAHPVERLNSLTRFNSIKRSSFLELIYSNLLLRYLTSTNTLHSL